MLTRQNSFRPSVEILENRLCMSAVQPVEVGGLKLDDVPAAAAMDFFLKLEGIDGESTDDKHKIEIQIDRLAVPAPTTPAVDYLLVLEGVDGGTGSRQGGAFEILSFELGAENNSSAGTPHFFDGRLLSAQDLTREQATVSGSMGRDLLLGGAGQDAGSLDPEYKYVSVRRTADASDGDVDGRDFLVWQRGGSL